ncbi:MAG: hypothetical protein V4548_10535 [Bacteroidota bacterium]
MINERWKYQIKIGLPFGILLSICMSFPRSLRTSFSEEFLSTGFLLQLFVSIVGGIFGFGYYIWKEKVKKDSKK